MPAKNDFAANQSKPQEIQALNHDSIVFGQLLRLLPRHGFDANAPHISACSSLRLLSRWTQFVALGLGQLASRQSLRDIVPSLRAQPANLYRLGMQTVSRSSLARVNAEQPHTLYEALVGRLLSRCLKFLRRLDRAYPRDLTLHVILNNYATHKHKAVRKWLAAHPRFKLWSCPSSVDTYPLGEEEESTMPKSRPPYPAAFRQQMVELVRSGRTPGELAREFEPSAEAIRNWVAQADRDAGKRSDGLRTEEHEEIRRLRRENRQLREEREILAKATAWFARETGPGRSTGS